jgi:hypothetical protein
MTMTKEHFEQAVRNQAPPEILTEELAGIEDRYEAYLRADEMFDHQVAMGYEQSPKTGKATMYFAGPKELGLKLVLSDTPKPSMHFVASDPAP